ncbi:uncharacterized protein I303_104929 [Kwoniella dejecticola CBS 10117]|uniref:FAD dependent oxidoreductase domain-containing protein n=1 Tax=Kwoniella dejecticola CBS 10117 TaxID=1296121 RepID=A0A1A6A3Y1_9TREE|nr:uncharacterized protein I303_05625 [Kwoniella dejecticola CBS 10117]OBR84766.1 hypothetical protein I303_05625 [Kwoniella dejecticola CBS 10117]
MGEKINIVGAGIFGLSLAVALRQRGYEVTVFDKNDYSQDEYKDFEVQAASVDQNKIFRASYGKKIHYQRLAMEAREKWEQLGNDLFVSSGMLRVQPTANLGALELETIANMRRDGLRDKLFIKGDKDDELRAKEARWHHKLLDVPIPDLDPSQSFAAVLDTTAGFTRSSEACLHYFKLAQGLGIPFVLGAEKGAFDSLIKVEYGGGGCRIQGIRTKDGVEHLSDKTVIAAGSFSTQLLPELSYHIESSGGSVARFKIDPKDTALWDKYSPAKFPVITWKSASRDAGGKDIGSIYVFPRTEEGIIKIGYRGVKYTHFQTAPEEASFSQEGQWSVPANRDVKPPQSAVDAIRYFVSIFLPEFTDVPFYSTKFCWYTDSLDNEFVIDYCPSYTDNSLFICTGGSGHGAKFLPVLGEHAADIFMHGDDAQTPLRSHWRWRSDAPRVNGLEEGPRGPRNLTGLARTG